MSSMWEKVYKEEIKSYKWQPFVVMKDFLVTLKKTDAQRVLDLGCGIGRNAIFLAKEGYFVTGIDISRRALQAAAEKIEIEELKNIILHYGDVVSLPFPTGHFDAAFSVNVIHHARLRKIKLMVDEIFRVLRKNGVGMVTVVSTKDYKYGRGKKIEKNTYVLSEGTHKEAGIPHHFFDEDEVKSLLKNFRITEIKHIEGKVEGGINCHWYVTFIKE